MNWFEFGWYSCPTCPPGGWDCGAFKPTDISGLVATKANVAKTNQTLGCYSKWLVDTLNISVRCTECPTHTGLAQLGGNAFRPCVHARHSQD